MTADSPSSSPRPLDHASMIDAALRQVQDLPTVVGRPRTASELPFPTDPDAIPGYHIEREVSRGGQGVVYEAVQCSTGRRVAIKLLLAGPFASPDERARFEREVRVLGRLRHPNIVSIHHSDAFGGGFYYAMDYIAGRPLDAYVRAQKLDVAQTLRLFATICDALSAAHLRGIIHRDLKPGNVRVDDEGVPHVLDFGLSKMADDPHGLSATRTGQFVGSLPWASPEQAAGESDGIDVRTDVYSLGVLLFQMLTDDFPYVVTGRASEVLETIRHTPPARPRALRRELSEDIDTIVLKCLQKERERRYQSAREIAADVRRFLGGEPIEARRDSNWYVIRKQLWRHRAPLGVAAAFIALLVVSSIVAWSLYAAANSARARAEEKSTEARARLWDAYLAQARATRTSSRVGRRGAALEAIRQAVAIRPSLELRNEAVAALALTDLKSDGDFVATRASASGLAVLDRFVDMDNEGHVRVIDANDGRLIAEPPAPPLPGWQGQFSPDGRYLAAKFHQPSHDAEAQLRVWDLQTNAIVYQSAPPDYTGGYFFFTADGREFVLVGADRLISVCSVPSFERLREFRTSGRPYRLALDPSGRRLAISSLYQPHLEIRDFQSGELLHTLDQSTPIRGPAWSADGATLAAPSDDGRIYEWRFPGVTPTAGFIGHQMEAVEVYFDPAGRFAVSWGWDNVSRFWNPITNQLLFDPVEGWMVSEVRDRIAVFRRPDRFSFYTFEPPVAWTRLNAPAARGWNDCAVAADGSRIAASGEAGVWLLTNGSSRDATQLLDVPARGGVVAGDKTIMAADARGIHRWRLEGAPADVPASHELLWAAPNIIALSASPSGRFLAVRTDAELLCFDTSSRVITARYPSFPGIYGAPSITGDGRYLFCGTWRGAAARVIDTTTAAAVLEIPAYIITGQFTPRGDRLLISERSEYRVYDAAAWTVRSRIPRSAHAAVPGTSAISRDGRVAALTRTNYDVFLVDLDTGRTFAELPNPGLAFLGPMRLSADDRILALTGDRAIQAWNLGDLRMELQRLGLDWDGDFAGQSAASPNQR